jgi:type I restriction enzyme S subunit
MAAVGAGTGVIDASIIRKYAEVKKGYTYFRDGDVLFAKITPCMENGKMAVARQLRNGIGFGSTEFHVLRPREGVDAHYVYHFVSSARFRAEAAHHMTGAVGQKRVPAAFLEQSEIPLPPIDDQRRIVAEMEKQFSRLDEAVANLKRVGANLKRYKATVLKSAVEGHLVVTEAELARREGRKYETGNELLRRICEARRNAWNNKGEYKESGAPNATELPELPEGWVWASIGQVGNVIGGLTKNSKRNALRRKLPYLRVANVYADELRLDEVERIGVAENELEKLRLQADDLLIVEGNGSVEQIGRVARWDGSIEPCAHQNHLIKVRLSSMSPRWVLLWMLSPQGRRQIESAAASTSGLYTLSTGKVGRLAVPVPPLAEQHRVVAEVDRCFSVGEGLKSQVFSGLRRAGSLHNAILRKILSG